MKNLKFIILILSLIPLLSFGQSRKKKTKISCYSCTEIEYEDCDICKKGTTAHFNGIIVERGSRKPRMIPSGFLPIVDERNKKVMILDWLNSTRLDKRITTIELADTEYNNMDDLMNVLNTCNCPAGGGGTDNQRMSAVVNGDGTFSVFLTGLTPTNYTIDVNTIVETTADVVTTAAINSTTGDLEFFDGAGDILATAVLPSGTNMIDADGDTGLSLVEGAEDQIDFNVDGNVKMSLTDKNLSLNGIVIDLPIGMELEPQLAIPVDVTVPSNTLWLNAGASNQLHRGSVNLETLVNGNDRHFASETGLSPATSGAPTLSEITSYAATNSLTNTMLVYTGTDTNTDPVTHVYFLDNSGVATEMNTPLPDDVSITSGTLPSATANRSVPMGGNSLTVSGASAINLNSTGTWGAQANTGIYILGSGIGSFGPNTVSGETVTNLVYEPTTNRLLLQALPAGATEQNILTGTPTAATAARNMDFGSNNLTMDNLVAYRANASSFQWNALAGSYKLGDAGSNLPPLDSDVDSRVMALALNGDIYQTNAAAWKTRSGTGAPVDGITTAYYVGQLYVDDGTQALYRATAKSTDPDASGAGSTWIAISGGGSSASEIIDTDGDTRVTVEETPDKDEVKFFLDGVAKFKVAKNGGVTVSATHQYLMILQQNSQTESIVQMPNTPNAKVWDFGHDNNNGKGFYFEDATNGTIPFVIRGDDGALQASQYSSPTSITGGTPIGSLVFDATGKILTAPLVNIPHNQDFITSDWTVGTTNTLVISQATHGLPIAKVYHVTVIDSSGDIVVIDTNINPTTGDVTLSTTGATFSGSLKIQ